MTYTEADVDRLHTIFAREWTRHQPHHPVPEECDPGTPAEDCCDQRGLRAVLDALVADGRLTAPARPALRPGEGQHGCFLADRCVNDPRCTVRSDACERARPVVTVERPDEEHIEIHVNGDVVASASHDEHGWSGMDAVERTALAVARAAGCNPAEG